MANFSLKSVQFLLVRVLFYYRELLINEDGFVISLHYLLNQLFSVRHTVNLKIQESLYIEIIYKNITKVDFLNN